jgi:hypothetical protein
MAGNSQRIWWSICCSVYQPIASCDAVAHVTLLKDCFSSLARHAVFELPINFPATTSSSTPTGSGVDEGWFQAIGLSLAASKITKCVAFPGA